MNVFIKCIEIELCDFNINSNYCTNTFFMISLKQMDKITPNKITRLIKKQK